MQNVGIGLLDRIRNLPRTYMLHGILRAGRRRARLERPNHSGKKISLQGLLYHCSSDIHCNYLSQPPKQMPTLKTMSPLSSRPILFPSFISSPQSLSCLCFQRRTFSVGQHDRNNSDDHKRSGALIGTNISGEDEALPFLVNKLNFAIRNHPYESLVSLVGLEIATIFGCYGIILASNMHFSAEFALAFALSRPLRRLRFPIEIAAAAGLSRIWPSLRAIQLSNLINVVPSSMKKKFQSKSESEGNIGRGMRFLQETIDKYGASYFIGARIVGVTLVFALYEAIKLGVDVHQFLEYLGIADVGSVLADWAAAVVASSSLYPVSISMTAFVAPQLAALRKRMLHH